MAIKLANEIREITKENRDSLNLCNCNKKLLEEIEHEINDTAYTGNFTAYVFVKDKDYHDDGFTLAEIDCAVKYLEESLGYNVQYVVKTTADNKNQYFKICINW